jgi:hypothetical protein
MLPEEVASAGAQTSFKVTFSGNGLECGLCLRKRCPACPSPAPRQVQLILDVSMQAFYGQILRFIFLKEKSEKEIFVCVRLSLISTMKTPYTFHLKSPQKPLGWHSSTGTLKHLDFPSGGWVGISSWQQRHCSCRLPRCVPLLPDTS